MSSEPIERRVSYIGDRLKGSRCSLCGKEYFRPRDYCGTCGRKSFGKMEDIDFFYEEGELEVCTLVREPTNKFVKLGAYIYCLVSFHNGKVRVPGRLTDLLFKEKEVEPSSFEGRSVVPRFRRRYSVEQSDIIPTIALTFTMADEYYPYQGHEIVKPSKEYETPGIVGYGVYTSRFRIKEGAVERSVPFLDEDAITAAVEAGKMALVHAGVDPSLVAKVYVGSESNPYAVKPIASKVAQVLKLGEEDKTEGVQSVDAIDTEFACKAATSMFKDAAALVHYPGVKNHYTMVIGTDNSQAAPRDEIGGELDFFVGYGGSAFIFGMHDVVAEIEGWCSCTSDTPDFWRRDQECYPRHGGRFTGIPAYFKHTVSATQGLMNKLGLKTSDFDFVVFHMPNGKFPERATKILGFDQKKLEPGFIVPKVGNTYSGSSLLGLAATLDVAKPGQRILITSYGSGAGSDSFSIKVTDLIEEKRKKAKKIQDYIDNKEYVTYAQYTRLRRGI